MKNIHPTPRRILVTSVLVLFLILSPLEIGSITLDQTFGSGGKLTVDFSNTAPRSSEAFWGFQQPSGRVVLAGNHGDPGPIVTNSAFAMCGLSQFGNLDMGFGTDGRTLEWNSFYNAEDMKMLPDGKLLRLGSVFSFPSSSPTLVRLNSNGSTDSGFSADLTLGNDHTRPYKIAARLDGKIYVLLGSFSGNGYSLVRLNSNGSRDATFGTNGVQPLNLNRLFGFGISGMHVLENGRLLMGGFLQTVPAPTGSDVVWIARFDEHGYLDRSFGSQGIVRRQFPTNVNVAKIIVQPDGKYLAIGTSRVGSTESKILIARFTSRGRPDTGFGSNGIVITNVSSEPGTLDAGHSGVLMNDGRIIVVGIAQPPMSTVNNFLVARFSVSGEFENSIAIQFSNGLSSYAFDAVTQTDGKLLVTGFTRNSDATANGNLFAVARFNPGS